MRHYYSGREVFYRQRRRYDKTNCANVKYINFGYFFCITGQKGRRGFICGFNCFVVQSGVWPVTKIYPCCEMCILGYGCGKRGKGGGGIRKKVGSAKWRTFQVSAIRNWRMVHAVKASSKNSRSWPPGPRMGRGQKMLSLSPHRPAIADCPLRGPGSGDLNRTLPCAVPGSIPFKGESFFLRLRRGHHRFRSNRSTQTTVNPPGLILQSWFPRWSSSPRPPPEMWVASTHQPSGRAVLPTRGPREMTLRVQLNKVAVSFPSVCITVSYE